MRCFLFFFLFALAVPAFLAGQSKIQRQLEALERQRFEAMVSKDLAFLKSVLSDDLAYTHSNGLFETKAEHLKNIESGVLAYLAIEPESIRAKVYGKTAVLTGLVNLKAVSKGKEFSARLRYTDVYVRRRGAWRLVAWHSVRAEP